MLLPPHLEIFSLGIKSSGDSCLLSYADASLYSLAPIVAAAKSVVPLKGFFVCLSYIFSLIFCSYTMMWVGVVFINASCSVFFRLLNL